MSHRERRFPKCNGAVTRVARKRYLIVSEGPMKGSAVRNSSLCRCASATNSCSHKYPHVPFAVLVSLISSPRGSHPSSVGGPYLSFRTLIFFARTFYSASFITSSLRLYSMKNVYKYLPLLFFIFLIYLY